MTDLIERDIALLALGDIHQLDYNLLAVKARLLKIPAVDAEPVRHGRWQFPLPKPYNKDAKRCSECHQTQSYGLLKYCHNCGAKMDGGANDA